MKEVASTFQHYVPQLLLRRFASDKWRQYIFVYDKVRGIVSESRIRTVAGEIGFDDFTLEGIDASLDPDMRLIEDLGGKVIYRIVKSRGLTGIRPEDRLTLSNFVAMQFVRTPWWKSWLGRTNLQIADKLRRMGEDPDNVHGFKEWNEEDVNIVRIKTIMDFGRYTRFFYLRPWLLYSTSDDKPFCISDNPVIMRNRNSYPVGLMMPFTEVYLPLSKNFTLAMHCRIITERMGMKAEGLDRNLNFLDGSELPDAKKYWEAFVTGKALSIPAEGVSELNLLQAMWAKRWVMSSRSDFHDLKAFWERKIATTEGT